MAFIFYRAHGFECTKISQLFPESQEHRKDEGKQGRNRSYYKSNEHYITESSYNLQNQNHVSFVLCSLFANFFIVITSFKKPKCFLYAFHIKPVK